MKYHSVTEQLVQQGNISIARIPTKKYVADLLTKPSLCGDLMLTT